MFQFFDNDQDTATTTANKAPGRVSFDERGNAIYAWQDAKLEQDGKRGEKMRERALLHPALSLVDDAPAAEQPVVRNEKGTRLGYNPYESGQLLGKPQPAKKPNMRELSKWIEMKRRLAKQSNSTEE